MPRKGCRRRWSRKCLVGNLGRRSCAVSDVQAVEHEQRHGQQGGGHIIRITGDPPKRPQGKDAAEKAQKTTSPRHISHQERERSHHPEVDGQPVETCKLKSKTWML